VRFVKKAHVADVERTDMPRVALKSHVPHEEVKIQP
jgi:hypothetical protein